jgi:cell division protein FtsW (lipid II flippase)
VSVTEPERPKAPWHPFPLVELLVLAGIVLLILGLINWETDRGRAMLVSGMLLGSLGGLDTALREHFGGYRSHATIIAGVIAVGLAAGLYFAGAPWIVIPAAAVAAFALALWLLMRDYKRRER